MYFQIELIPTDKYYADFYQDWVSQKWLRRWQPYLAVFMILFWAGLLFLDSGKALGITPQLFMALGGYELGKHFYSKHRWFKERRGSRVNGQKTIIQFRDESIKFDGPFTTGQLKWSGIKEIKQTPSALLLIPENGISIYLPKALFNSPEQVDAVLKAQSESLRNRER